MRFILPALTIVVLATACVPRDQYDALEVEKNYYQNLVERNDSIQSSQALQTYGNASTTQRELDQYIRQVEALTATNQSLNRSFQDLQNRYQTLLEQNDQLLTSSGEQVTSLQQSLADRQAELDQREQELRQAEITMSSREAQLSQLGNSDPNAFQPATYGNQSTINNQQLALKQNQVVAALQLSLDDYNPDLHYMRVDGNDKIILTVAEMQLFTDGFQLSIQGRQFLQDISSTLYYQQVDKIEVIGHEDPSVEDQSAFENSTDRAIAIVRFLRDHGLRDGELIAGGQGASNPEASSNTPANRAINRRTDIIISLED